VLRRQGGDQTVTHASYPPGTALPWHGHSRSAFCFVLRGTMVEESRRRPLQLRRHDLIFTSAQTEHRDQFGEHGAECLIIDFGSTWLDSLEMLASPVDPGAEPTQLCGARAADICLRLASEIREPDPVTPLAIESCCLELLTLFARATSGISHGAPPWLRRARDLVIQRHLENFGIESLARDVGVHPAHLAQRFRHTYGTSIFEFVRRLRVRTAAAALTSSDLPITAIALASGFYDQAHLTRTFKRHVACTPAEYRRRHQTSAATS
jgi:AraC family transcriptional regulator